MILTARYKKAIDLATDLFRDEIREVSNVPYVTHLFGVSHIVGQVTDDEDVRIAALLHDVLEDIPADKYSNDQMIEDFGEKVYDIVKTISHDEVTYGKEEARRQYLEQIKQGSIEACLVSAADLLHNSTDLFDNFTIFPDKTKAILGGAERAKRREWFWGKRFEILSERLGHDNLIIIDLKPIIQKLPEIHQQMAS